MKHPRHSSFYAVETRKGGILAIFREEGMANLYAAGVKGRVLPWLLPTDSFAFDDDVPSVAGDHAIAKILNKRDKVQRLVCGHPYPAEPGREPRP